MSEEIDSLIKEISEKLQKRAEEFGKKGEDVTVVLNEENFDEIIKNNRLVLVDCWAEWCAPCHLYEPIYKKVAEKYKGKAVFGRLNVDENQKIADQYSVLNIPTTLIFLNGKLVDNVVGAVDEDTLESVIKKYLE
ncbi:thioredoxin [Sulfolobus sp. A20]|uniref:thioredoxin n=1 Tax=Sulfolobaceae TaxID=118883 RepID=UPI000863C47D|nr:MULTISPECIES: thioredoxin [unclassified Sulfolobus]TRM75428.1 thioredoxin [Sulfolobus sp. E5]TRM76025.1 thioredoxin [Sulfolobus sp. A20-N-F8]TRM77558.1 thioredoxin [Sulfolobus sp. B5]TRM80357.1 thioredoxin [Sulfolobus sp. D5]TRM84111.1 thioredoxin [Sulfolobus sp. F3]TRM87132.1 thioredoxin [Sulfolobus sp. C3]TRM93280.1 thioredoxin [Sulfolobus sp. A20-N-G8]TRN00533.1 thioredoxin [Sulfolobus sp. E1]TRN01481.1 thioredoxin [Sulfolobus sp. F1]